jgi:hypothetical protein
MNRNSFKKIGEGADTNHRNRKNSSIKNSSAPGKLMAKSSRQNLRSPEQHLARPQTTPPMPQDKAKHYREMIGLQANSFAIQTLNFSSSPLMVQLFFFERTH